MSKLYIIETISQHRITFCIEAESKDKAIEYLEQANFESDEFGQQWLGQTVISATETTEENYIELFDEITDYLKHVPKERKLEYIIRPKTVSE